MILDTKQTRYDIFFGRNIKATQIVTMLLSFMLLFISHVALSLKTVVVKRGLCNLMHFLLMFLLKTPLVRKKKYVAIRSENRELREQQLDDDDEEQGRRRLASVHYMASQYLTESSLNTDVSQFDFGGSVCFHQYNQICPIYSNFLYAKNFQQQPI